MSIQVCLMCTSTQLLQGQGGAMKRKSMKKHRIVTYAVFNVLFQSMGCSMQPMVFLARKILCTVEGSILGQNSCAHWDPPLSYSLCEEPH